MTAAALVSGTACYAYTQYPAEGGQWNYGYTALGAYSDYLHPSAYHGSTVVCGGSRNDAEAAAGNWSQAILYGTYSGTSFYYSLR